MERRAADTATDALQHHGLFETDQQPRRLLAIRAGVIVADTQPHHPKRVVQNFAVWASEKHNALTDDLNLNHRR